MRNLSFRGFQELDFRGSHFNLPLDFSTIPRREAAHQATSLLRRSVFDDCRNLRFPVDHFSAWLVFPNSHHITFLQFTSISIGETYT